MLYVTRLKRCVKCAVAMPPSSKKVTFPLTFPLGLLLFCTKLYWKYSLTFFTFHISSHFFHFDVILHARKFSQMSFLDLLKS